MPATFEYPTCFRIFALPIFFAIVSCFQLILFNYPYGHDWILELVRLEEYYAALQSGQIIPFWSNNLYSGFGSPIFLFYAPLYNFFASCFLFIGVPLTNAAILTFTSLIILAAIGMAGLIWELNDRSTKPYVLAASRVAAIAYILAPYLIANMMVRNASAEFAAMCLAPYPFWGLAMIFNNRKSGYTLVSLGLTLSVLAHNLTALVIAFSTSISILIIYIKTMQHQVCIKSFLSVLIGIGMATWFWLPAIWLKGTVRIDDMTLGKFDVKNNFNTIIDLFSYDYFYSVGFFPLIVILLGVLILLFKSKEKIFLCSLIIASFGLIFLQVSASSFIWENVPFIPLFQFTWRMMGPFSFIIAILLALLIINIKIKSKLYETLIIFIIVINSLHIFKQYQKLPDEVFNIVSNSITRDVIRKNQLPATVLDEYLPKTADISISKENILNDFSILSELPDIFTSVNKTIDSVALEYVSDETIPIEFSKWFYPVWKANLNSNDILHIKQSQKGTLVVNIPKGSNKLVLELVQPRIRNIGFIISFFFTVLFIILLFNRKNKN